jgi:Fe-S cluster assembly protein SufD
MSAPLSPYADQFAAAQRGLPGAGAPWLATLRRAALDRFNRSGFPTRKVEAWKFTDLGHLAGIEFDNTPPTVARALIKDDLVRHRLSPDSPVAVFVNGEYRADLSDLHGVAGVRVRNLAAADEAALRTLAAPSPVADEPRAQALVDLNLAFMRDGAVIDVDARVATPLQLLYVAAPQTDARGGAPVFHLRNLIRVAAGAEASVVETYAGPRAAAYWTNAVTRIEVAAGAALRHVRLQAEGAAATHIGATSVRLAQGAAYRLFAATLGGELARNEIEIDFAEPEATAELAGVALACGRQHLDTTTRVSHSVPQGTSRQDFRNVVDAQAHAVFQGRVRVAPGAQKTDAQQLNRSLLLSATAAADTKPELEILADDVKCSHGAAIGDLDQDSLFYLRARGVGEAEARVLLIEAFVGHLIDGIADETMRPYVRRHVDGWLRELGLRELTP